MGRSKLPIRRETTGDGFVYRRSGRRISRRSEIARIERLAIPPAWTDVAIAASRSAKVLASGVDAAGRTQHIYHPRFRRLQEQRKYERMERFAAALPKLRARVDRDMRRRGLTRDRVAACVVRLIDQQLFRVGNAEYAEAHQSYGITTLHAEHLAAGSTYVDFDFVGKSGKRQQRRVRDPRSARVIAQLLELPGREVFRFLDDGDVVRSLRSRDVNAYVKRHLGEEFSAKDFRTWGGTVAVVSALCAAAPEDLATERGRAAAVRQGIRVAAERLGNTPEVTRSSYVDPRVIAVADDPDRIEAVRNLPPRRRKHFGPDEQRTAALLGAG